MPYDKPEMELFSVLRDDVPDELVRKLLKEQREVGLFMRYSLQHWDILKESHPHLSRYIAITSYQAAPHDALMREKIAASLLGLCLMMDTAMADRFERRLKDDRDIGKKDINREPSGAGDDVLDQQPAT